MEDSSKFHKYHIASPLIGSAVGTIDKSFLVHFSHIKHFRRKTYQDPIMLLKLNLFLFVAFVAHNAKTANAVQSCIGNLTTLVALQEARGNKVAIPVTYIMCPNTVYEANDFEYLELNGNASYLCGDNGASANQCIIRGGELQVSIFLYSYEDSVKDNILVSGFTFEQSTSTFGNAAIASDGRSTFRDCIFKVSCLCCCYRGL
jgi:hypothetical protein